jgi:aspartyl protease family protein
MVGASMFRYAAVAAAGALLSLGAIQVVSGSAAHAAAEAPLRGPQGSGPEPARLSKAADGHFWADGVIDGRTVHFLVDTGASSVFLTPEDVRRLGVDPSGLIYNRTVHTGGGDSLAAPVTLSSVSVDGVNVANVDALVIGRGLPASLLGMSYLGRLSKFEATPTSLVLNP